MRSKILLLVVLISHIFIQLVVATEDCKGENQYLDSNDEKCKQCQKCPPGQQPKGHCGYGEKHSGYKCESCPGNTFSNQHDYNLCVVCKPCATWNSVVAKECSSKTNRVCGACLSGHFKPMKSDGTMDDECHLCSDATKDNPQCQNPETVPWKKIAFIVGGISVLLTLIFGIIICVLCKKKVIQCGFSPASVTGKSSQKDNSSHRSSITEQSPMMEKALLTSKDEKTCVPGLNLLRSRCHWSESEDGEDMDGHGVHVVQDVDQSINNGQAETVLSKSPLVVASQYEEKSEIQMKAEPTRSRLLPAEIMSIITTNSNYSNMPTAEYDEDVPDNNMPTMPMTGNNLPSYSNLPTRQYEEEKMESTLNRNSNSSTRPIIQESLSSTHSFRRRGSAGANRKRRPHLVDTTSSIESLLDNVDRDSKLVGGKRTSISPLGQDYVAVEFFDTGSIDNDLTKPHIVANRTTNSPCQNPASRTVSPTFRPATPTSCNQSRPVNFQTNMSCQPHPNIIRPRPVIPTSFPNGSLIPPPNVRSNSLKHQSQQSCEPCSLNRSLSSSEAILSSHTINIQKIKEKFEEACIRVKDQPLDKLDSNLADRITLKLTDRPEGTGEAYPTIKTWRHVANCFKIEAVTVDNSRSLSDILRYLRAHRRHTIRDLLNAVNHIQRYDVLSDICNHILGLQESESAMNHFEEHIPKCVVTQA
ncbi:uncharacterized protein LOC120340748 isoform X1 [Styela clava]